jgi:hypothetical protein
MPIGLLLEAIDDSGGNRIGELRHEPLDIRRIV